MKIKVSGQNGLPKFRLLLVMLVMMLNMLLITGCADSDDDDEGTTVISTEDGDLLCIDGSSMISCKGIPYALPPTGTRRFAAPEAITEARTNTLDATEFADTCPQLGLPGENEDCLYLNVYVPKTGDENYPVMVWIHGGAFLYGSGSEDIYDPAGLVAEGVILVTLNYRLGMLGFLTHPALTAEAGESGNYGLMDQQMALQWVQDHIADFGGDPTNVTIFGQSAGGHSVLSQMAAPGSADLFSKAIIQSGTFGIEQRAMNDYSDEEKNFLEAVGCPATGVMSADVDCLRSLDVDDILKAQFEHIFDPPLPAYGGSFLPLSFETAFATGAYPVDASIMIGCNKDEGHTFSLDYGDTDVVDDTGYETVIGTILAGSQASLTSTVADEYMTIDDPNSPLYDNRYFMALGALRTDIMFDYGNKRIWDLLSTNSTADIFGYWFTDEEAPVTEDYMVSSESLLGAAHSFELQYIFGTLSSNGGTSDQIALSEMMTDYWTNFAKYGDPNDGVAVTWNPYHEGGFVLKLDDPAPVATDVDEFCATHHCTFWDTYSGP
jgi:para-nitrobenzyl esterase